MLLYDDMNDDKLGGRFYTKSKMTFAQPPEVLLQAWLEQSS